MEWTSKGGGLISGSVSNGPEVQCGFELGDWLSYVSAGRDQLQSTVDIDIRQANNHGLQAHHDVELVSGEVAVNQTEEYHNEAIHRTLVASSESGTPLGDFVARFAISDADATAHIAGRTFYHCCENRYRQFETNRAYISGSWGNFEVFAHSVSVPEGFTPVTYVRDEPSGDWVVHVRVIADGGEGFLRLYRGPVKRLALLDQLVDWIPGVRQRSQYLRETSAVNSRWIPAQYVRLSRLPPNHPIEMQVTGTLTADG